MTFQRGMELINAVSSYLNDVAESERSQLFVELPLMTQAMLAPIIPHRAKLQHAALHKGDTGHHEPWPIFDEAQVEQYWLR